MQGRENLRYQRSMRVRMPEKIDEKFQNGQTSSASWKVEENQIIKNAIPINLMVFLLLSHVIYIGIRCYVKDWQEERGYFKI